MPSEPDALPLAGSEARRPTSFAARWPWQLLQLLATILTGVWPRRGAWWSVAVASLVCVAATPLLASLHARDAGFDDEALFTHAAQAPCDQDHRLVDPLELFAECEQQAVTDATEEVKVEALSAILRRDNICAPARLSRELCASRNIYAVSGSLKSQRDQYGPRGPPRT